MAEVCVARTSKSVCVLGILEKRLATYPAWKAIARFASARLAQIDMRKTKALLAVADAEQ